MKAVYDARQARHDPKFRLEDGVVVQNPDRPERVEALMEGALAAGCVFAEPTDHGMAPLASIHSPRYLRYLATIYERRRAMRPNLAEVVPTRFCRDPNARYSDESEAAIGFHNADTSCPISAPTWDAVYWSAQTALSGADLLLSGERAAYALCRPSGHHAYSEISGGFCFVNNSAVAAQYLLSKGHRPAVLDIDVHHGNGTQAIFYARDDVLTLSIHVDPEVFYPFYSGSAQERGAAQGLGYNYNYPLPRGAGMDIYFLALDAALAAIRYFGASAVVVALGLDTHENDPFKGMTVTTEGFSEIAKAISGLDLPVLNVQEGGYMQPALPANLRSYLRGLTA